MEHRKSEFDRCCQSSRGKGFRISSCTNVSQALQGLVPGMTFGVDAKGGQLNNTPSVSIRGAGTIGKGSTGSPLI